ncbi:SAM-dependent methyltransferase [Natronosporangium hydrolyticum]|uniref:S-adenosyl-L-methionine-dependent methyltransferase n=1 Tax=Natronosporangium hydrolyticum TaxID=2811111 RepID=A0A895Y4S6_9ACTN|nr:SAM-dependent methyltransferase [Natronosporangium hydrolyticum]QSB12697.1 SAM-dependent methyltransferase [Natronosporangium hydrolyticum]
MAPRVDPGVQATAFLAAACRAVEQDRPQPRLRDPFAASFVAARGPAQPGYRGLLEAGGDEVVTRTLLVDQLLAAELAGPTAPLVVNLGSGFCARPYRLDLSAAQLVLELDSPELHRLKSEVLGEAPATCPVRRIGADLRDQSALREVLAAECGAASRVVVVSEGLLPYLPPPALTALAGTLADALPPGTVWLTDVVSADSARQMAALAGGVGARVELHGLVSLDPFTEVGWEPADYRILPVARRGPIGRPGGAGHRSSHQIVDGVLALTRRR